jgi:hypothetical protein
MATLGFIGAGHIGSTLAKLAIAAGYDVVLSNSRGPESLASLIAELGPKARAATPREAAEAGELVVVTVPMKVYTSVPVEPLVGKLVIDTNNYYPGRDGRMAEAHLPGSKVVKAFNVIYFKHLEEHAQPAGSKNRRALPIAGNDAQAKKTVAGLIDTFGFDVIDTGPLSEGWRFQPDLPAYYHRHNAEELKEALGKARRYAELKQRD